MTNEPNHLERIECRLVIIDGHSSQILIVAAAESSLPREWISPYTRAAETLTEAVRHRYGLCTLQLAHLPRSQERGCYAVLEIIRLQEAIPGALTLTTLDKIDSSELNEEERALVAKIMRGDACKLGRFARLGWIDELLARAGGSRDRRSWPAFRQLNQGIDFCLLNLRDSEGRNLWFKAVGEPNTREYLVTLELTRECPQYLPRLVQSIPEWNGWIAEAVDGVPLNESGNEAAWEQAVMALAFLQRGFVGKTASLFQVGAIDWTCARLASLSKPFFEEARQAMRAQASSRVKPLDDRELNRLQSGVEDALTALANSAIPETLLHGDIGHGNILVSPQGPVFLDWAETYIGHPFVSAEHLLADHQRSRPEFSRERCFLRRLYADCWQEYTTPEALAEASAYAPAVAAFAYAVIGWEARARRSNPICAWPLIRSLLRRTQRELESRMEVSV